jgi:hypothetical protein
MLFAILGRVSRLSTSVAHQMLISFSRYVGIPAVSCKGRVLGSSLFLCHFGFGLLGPSPACPLRLLTSTSTAPARLFHFIILVKAGSYCLLPSSLRVVASPTTKMFNPLPCLMGVWWVCDLIWACGPQHSTTLSSESGKTSSDKTKWGASYNVKHSIFSLPGGVCCSYLCCCRRFLRRHSPFCSIDTILL